MEKASPALQSRKQRRGSMQKPHIHFKLAVLCANDLANKDVGLLQGDVSDPYVVAYLRNASGKTLHKKQTKVVKDNLNPVWNREMFDISMYGESISAARRPLDASESDLISTVYFEVWDKDVSYGELVHNAEVHGVIDDFLGQCVLSWAHVSYYNRRETTHVLQLFPRKKKKEEVSGTLTVSTYHDHPLLQSVHEREKSRISQLGNELLAALQDDEVDIVKKVLKETESFCGETRASILDYENPHSKMTPLLMAVKSRANLQSIRMLLENGASTSRKTASDVTALYMAVEMQWYEAVKLLLFFNADPEQMANFDTPPMFVAALRNDARMMTILQQHGASLDQMHPQDGSTMLFQALNSDEIGCFKLLLSMGARTDIKLNHSNSTLVAEIAIAGRAEFLAALLDHEGQGLSNLNDPDTDGRTPMHHAARSGSVECLELLSKAGGNIDAVSNAGTTPLYSAILKKRAAAVEYLAQHANPNACTESGVSQLSTAARKGHRRVQEKLVSLGADVNWQDNVGRTPLILAVLNNQLRTLDFLLSAGADTSLQSKQEGTALHAAVLTHNVNMVRALLEGGADVKSRHVVSGETVLHVAARMGGVHDGEERVRLEDSDEATDSPRAKRGRRVTKALSSLQASIHKRATPIDLLKLLLEQGPDVNARDDSGLTPLATLAIAGTRIGLQMAEVLIENGADVNAVDNRERSAVCLAVCNGNLPMTQLLMKHLSCTASEVFCNSISQGTLRHLNDESVLKFLMESETFQPVFVTGEECYTLLHLAVLHNVERVFALLLRREDVLSFVNIATRDGFTALDLAAANRCVGMILPLLRAGAKLSKCLGDAQMLEWLVELARVHLSLTKKSLPAGPLSEQLDYVCSVARGRNTVRRTRVMVIGPNEVEKGKFLKYVLDGNSRPCNPDTSSITIYSKGCDKYDQVITFWAFSSQQSPILQQLYYAQDCIYVLLFDVLDYALEANDLLGAINVLQAKGVAQHILLVGTGIPAGMDEHLREKVLDSTSRELTWAVKRCTLSSSELNIIRPAQSGHRCFWVFREGDEDQGIRDILAEEAYSISSQFSISTAHLAVLQRVQKERLVVPFVSFSVFEEWVIEAGFESESVLAVAAQLHRWGEISYSNPDHWMLRRWVVLDASFLAIIFEEVAVGRTKRPTLAHFTLSTSKTILNALLPTTEDKASKLVVSNAHLLKSQLVARWSKLNIDEAIHPFLITLLQERQIIIHAMDSSAEQARRINDEMYVVPCRLDHERPRDVWNVPSVGGAGDEVADMFRKWAAPVEPHNVVSRVLISLYELKISARLDLCRSWRGGIVFGVRGVDVAEDTKKKKKKRRKSSAVAVGPTAYKTSVLVAIEDDDDTECGKVLTVRTCGPEMELMMCTLQAVVHNTLRRYYPGIVRCRRFKVTVGVGLATAEGIVEAGQPREDVLKRFLKDKNTSVSFGSIGSVRISHLLPELVILPAISHVVSDRRELLENSRELYEKQVKKLSPLGEGGFGRVFKATCDFAVENDEGLSIAVGDVVAVKELKVTSQSTDMMDTFFSEVSTMMNLRHPNLVQMLHFYVSPPALVMELVPGGALEDLVKKQGTTLTWQQITKIAKDVAQAMQYLHSQQPPIMHRDLRVANIFVVDLGAEGNEVAVKVGDLGNSARVSEEIEPTGSCWKADVDGYRNVLRQLRELAEDDEAPEEYLELERDIAAGKFQLCAFEQILVRISHIALSLTCYDDLEGSMAAQEEVNDTYFDHVMRKLSRAASGQRKAEVLATLVQLKDCGTLPAEVHAKVLDLLFQAVRDDDVGYLHSVLETGTIDCSHPLPTGTTLSHAAVELNRSECLLELFDAGADFSKWDTSGMTPLHLAVQCSQVTCLEAMLRAGVSTELVDKNAMQTALHVASSAGLLECMEVLLGFDADPNAVDANDYSPILYAAENRSPSAVEILLLNGAQLPAEREGLRRSSSIRLAASAPDHCGHVLLKQGSVVQSWKKVWMCLRGTQVVLYSEGHKQIESFSLGMGDEDRKLVFSAESEADREQWVAVLTKGIESLECSDLSLSSSPSLSQASIASASSSLSYILDVAVSCLQSMDYTTDRGIAEALNLRPFILSCSVPLLDEVNDRLNREPSARTKTLMTFWVPKMLYTTSTFSSIVSKHELFGPLRKLVKGEEQEDDDGLTIRNTGSVEFTVSFHVVYDKRMMITINPPELVIAPGKSESVAVSVVPKCTGDVETAFLMCLRRM